MAIAPFPRKVDQRIVLWRVILSIITDPKIKVCLEIG